MKITLLCDNPNSWIVPYVKEIKEELLAKNYQVEVIENYSALKKGDLAFFLACEEIVPEEYLRLNKHNLVIHESDLPHGKGWSPLTWQVLERNNEIPITLFEAAPELDAGQIYLQDIIELDGTELNYELKRKQGQKTKELILNFVEQYPNIEGEEQQGKESYYPRRTPEDSELDIDKTINEQFNLLRVVDNERYPAFFYKNGEKYVVKIYKEEEDSE